MLRDREQMLRDRGQSTHTFDQQRFNQQVVDVLDQMVQELDRQRAGKKLSNLAGIKTSILQLISSVERAQSLLPHPIQIGD